jgi:hypothetical protein
MLIAMRAALIVLTDREKGLTARRGLTAPARMELNLGPC